MSGLEAVEQIMSDAPGADPRALRRTSAPHASLAAAALAAGALDAMPRTTFDLLDPGGASGDVVPQAPRSFSAARA